MSDLVESIKSMPLAGLVPVAMLLLAGVVLCLAGRRLLRGAFMLMGFLLGALIGLLVAESTQLGMPGWVLPILCGVALAAGAAVTYRLAAAVAMALVLGFACPLSVIAVNELQVKRGHGITGDNDALIEVHDSFSDWIDKHDADETGDKAKKALKGAGEKVSKEIDELAAKHGLEEQAHASIEQVKTFSNAIAGAFKQRWDETPKRLRPLLMLSAIVGALTGLIIGLLARRFSDCAVTSMVGGAIALGAAHAIALRIGVPDGWWMPKSTIAWMGAWLVVGIIGLGIQWARRPKAADKPA